LANDADTPLVIQYLCLRCQVLPRLQDGVLIHTAGGDISRLMIHAKAHPPNMDPRVQQFNFVCHTQRPAFIIKVEELKRSR
jgi:hypothetical protein